MTQRTLLVLLLAAITPWAALQAQSSPQTASPGLEEAERLLAEGDAAAAVEAFSTVVETEPENARAWLGLGKARHDAGAEEEALAALARAGELGAPAPSVAFHSARVHASRGDLDAVRASLEMLADAGIKIWGQLQNTPELAALADEPSLEDVMSRLKPCATEEYRQFDFWLGEWDVHPASGTSVAANSIARLHGGCVIRESYRNGPYSGMSMNYYDESDGQWHQLWIDSQGLVLHLSGGRDGESMVLANETNRVSWTPADDGSVRQVWEQTSDDGETWNVVFDGKYVPSTDR